MSSFRRKPSSGLASAKKKSSASSVATPNGSAAGLSRGGWAKSVLANTISDKPLIRKKRPTTRTAATASTSASERKKAAAAAQSSALKPVGFTSTKSRRGGKPRVVSAAAAMRARRNILNDPTLISVERENSLIEIRAELQAKRDQEREQYLRAQMDHLQPSASVAAGSSSNSSQLTSGLCGLPAARETAAATTTAEVPSFYESHSSSSVIAPPITSGAAAAPGPSAVARVPSLLDMCSVVLGDNYHAIQETNYFLPEGTLENAMEMVKQAGLLRDSHLEIVYTTMPRCLSTYFAYDALQDMDVVTEMQQYRRGVRQERRARERKKREQEKRERERVRVVMPAGHVADGEQLGSLDSSEEEEEGDEGAYYRAAAAAHVHDYYGGGAVGAGSVGAVGNTEDSVGSGGDDEEEGDDGASRYLIRVPNERLVNCYSLNLHGQRALTNDGIVQVADFVNEGNMQSLCTVVDLDLSFCLNLRNSGLVALALQCPNLLRLAITGCEHITSKGISEVTRLCPKLRNLRVELTPRTNDAAVQDIVHNLKQLTSLNIGNCERVSNVGFQLLSTHCASLTALSCAGCHQMTDLGLGDLSKCVSLVSLSLRACSRITDGGAVQIARLGIRQQVRCAAMAATAAGGAETSSDEKGNSDDVPEVYCLKHLDLGGCSRLTDKTLLALAGGGTTSSNAVQSVGTSLQYLDLRGLNKLTSRSTALLAEHTRAFPVLRYVNLQFCEGIGPEAVAALRKARPELIVVD